MKLSNKLTEIRTRSQERTPDDIKAVMTNAADLLKETSFDVIEVGQELPAFNLLDINGQVYSNVHLNQQTIVTFYRGGW